MEEDYKFRYRLEPEKAEKKKVYSDPLVELIRSQLEQLLGLVVLTHKGEDVKVDGFKPLNTPERVYEIFPSDQDVSD